MTLARDRELLGEAVEYPLGVSTMRPRRVSLRRKVEIAGELLAGAILAFVLVQFCGGL